MAGLLDWMNTPQGIGLLSAVAGGMSGARRGTPMNNIGRGLVTGLQGYSSAAATDKEDKLKALKAQMAKQAFDAAVTPAQAAVPPSFKVGGQSLPTKGQAQDAAANMFNLPRAALPYGIEQPAMAMKPQESAYGMPESLMPQAMGIEDVSGGQAAPIEEVAGQAEVPASFNNDKYIEGIIAAGPDHPLYVEANKILLKDPKQTKYGNKVEFTADGRGYVMGDNGVPKFVDGITPRDELVADNLGGQQVYRTKYSADPLAVVDRTVTPDASLSDGRIRAEGAMNRGVTLRGQSLADARGREANALKAREVGIIGGKQAFDAEGKMADDYKAQSKEFVAVRDGYTRLNSSLKHATKSAAATLAGATSFMKLLDPGSVVRESELGMALAASGVIDRAMNYYNTLKLGKVLTERQAKDFENIGAKIYEAAEANQKSLTEQYRGRAQSYGLNPKNIITDYSIKKPPASPKDLPKKKHAIPSGWTVKER